MVGGSSGCQRLAVVSGVGLQLWVLQWWGAAIADAWVLLCVGGAIADTRMIGCYLNQCLV